MKVFDGVRVAADQRKTEHGFNNAGSGDDERFVEDATVDFLGEIEGFVDGRKLGKDNKNINNVFVEGNEAVGKEDNREDLDKIVTESEGPGLLKTGGNTQAFEERRVVISDVRVVFDLGLGVGGRWGFDIGGDGRGSFGGVGGQVGHVG